MKLAVASLALASVALLEGATAESSAGQCLAAVSAYAASGQNGYDNNGNEWGDQAAYYTQNNNYNAEEAAEEAETAITYNMQSLAEALGLNDQDGDGANNVYDDEGYLMAYDAELAESMGFDEDNEEDSATFAAFYKLTYELITNSGNYECVDNQDNQEDADEDEEDKEEDIIESILQNCQDLYEEAGIDLDDIDDGNDAIKDLSLHIRMEYAIASGNFVIQDGDYAQGYADLLELLGIDEDEIEDEDATFILLKLGMEYAIANGDLVIQDGDYAQGFADLLELLGIDEDEIEDEDATSNMLQLAISSGDFTTYLMNNAAYGQEIDNFDELLQDFFENLGIEGDINLEDLDASTAAAIYNKEMDVEEYGCQQAMIAQYGEWEAANQGYVVASESEAVQAAMDSMGMSPGAIAAIAIIAVVGLIGLVFIIDAKRKKKGEPLMDEYHLDDNAETV